MSSDSSKKVNLGLVIVSAVLAVSMVLMLIGVIPTLKDSQSDNARVAESEEEADDVKTSGADKQDKTSEGSAVRLMNTVEGSGFDSPKATLEAYTEAVNSGNVDKILSTFAVESYVKKFDTKADLERIRIFSPMSAVNMSYELSDGSAFDEDMRINVRQASIIRSLYNMIGYYTLTAEKYSAVPLKENEAAAFWDGVCENDFFNDWKQMKIVRFVSPADLSDSYDSERMQEMRDMLAKVYGCEEIEDVCAVAEIAGKEYYQFAECGKYNGKWYIINCTGMLSSLIGADANEYGLTACNETD